MFSEKMLDLGNVRSVIRETFEYGLKRSAEIGAENVFDFSLGNPSVPAPNVVNESLIDIINNTDSTALHGYTSAPGDVSVRKKIAEYTNNLYNTNVTQNNIYLTVGAAAALSITVKAIAEENDEIIVLAPFFPEYRVFIEAAGAKCVVVKCRESDFQIDIPALKAAINKNTKAIIINSPCNPSGVVFTKEILLNVANVLNDAQKEFEHPIFIIADEPYRELVYNNIEVPYIPNLYDNTVVCYSFSKSLSLPGERIGYILINDKCVNNNLFFNAVCGAGRALGYVCAPSIFQKIIPNCLGKTANIEIYEKNRNILYSALTNFGFEVIKPDGAFYLFVKSPDSDANKFCEAAKKFELLLVPSDSFGIEGFVRISYCVSTKQIENSLPAFEKLANLYFKEK